MYTFLLILPRLDPAGGIKHFRGSYDWFVFGFVAFMSYVYGLGVAWNLGWRFDMLRLFAPALGILFYGIGALMDRSKFNWFVGIRTPWTLNSEVVWEKTHRIAGKAFKVCGFLAFFGLIAEGGLALLLTVAPILGSGIFLTYYLYSEYQRQIRETNE